MYILWTTIQLESHLLNIPGAVSCCHCLEFSLRKPSQHLDIALFIMHLFFEGKFAVDFLNSFYLSLSHPGKANPRLLLSFGG